MRQAGCSREGAEELDRLGRHYDAACVLLEVATAEEESGRPELASEIRARAHVLLDALGCVNPF